MKNELVRASLPKDSTAAEADTPAIEANAPAAPGGLTRRGFLTRSGQGLTALLLYSQISGETPLHAQGPGGIGQSGPPPRTTDGYNPQLPYWSDLTHYDRPQYYETLQAGRNPNSRTYQSADIDGDGRDELLMRTQQAILVNRYDPATGQWIQIATGPALSDAAGWNLSQYYSTIQCADIDGDGRDEVIARSAGDIVVFGYRALNNGTWTQLRDGPPLSDPNGWNQPQYYTTIQCADIDGDGKAELLARSAAGLQVYQYDATSETWSSLPLIPQLSDANGYYITQYYATIQAADIDGDGRAEVLARGASGMAIYKYDPVAKIWNTLAGVAGLSDPAGFFDPASYLTIQCGDINGDGRAEIVARGPNGILAWNYDPTAKVWNQLSNGPALSNASGWNNPQYYRTLHLQDVDGDGAMELIGRGVSGIRAYKYNGQNGWNPLPNGPSWSDGANWNQVQYYSSIHGARTLLPGDAGYTGDGKHQQSVLIGRGSDSVQTFRLDGNAGQWIQTPLTAFPAFTGAALNAYDYITDALNIQGTNGGGIRYRYNDESTAVGQWLFDLKGTGVPAPPNIDPAVWQSVRNQIINELTWVVNVNDWYGTKQDSQQVAIFLSEQLSLTTVGDLLTFSSGDSSTLILSILSVIAASIAAIAGFPALEAGAAAAVAGTIGVATGAASQFMPNQGNSFATDFAKLQTQLADAFNVAITQLANTQFAITGGLSGGVYTPGDYSLLASIGGMITSSIWNWDSRGAKLAVAAAQRAYATEVLKTLMAEVESRPHQNMVMVQGYGPGAPEGYPDNNGLWFDGTNTWWLSIDTYYNYVSYNFLSNVFDPVTSGQVYPLGVPTTEFFTALNGWPTLYQESIAAPLPPVRTRLPRPALGADIRIALALDRDQATGDLLVTITFSNRGLTAATNLELVSARTNLLNAVNRPPTPHTRVAAGQQHTHVLRFPALTSGTRATLRISGRYLGGTFGGSFRIIAP